MYPLQSSLVGGFGAQKLDDLLLLVRMVVVVVVVSRSRGWRFQNVVSRRSVRAVPHKAWIVMGLLLCVLLVESQMTRRLDLKQPFLAFEGRIVRRGRLGFFEKEKTKEARKNQ